MDKIEKRLIKVGNGVGVLLDAVIRLNSGIHLGDKVSITYEKDRIIIEKSK